MALIELRDVERHYQLGDNDVAALAGVSLSIEAGEFVVSVQLDPPLGADAGALLETARALKEAGTAHFVDVNDNPRARARMSGVMVSVAIERA